MESSTSEAFATHLPTEVATRFEEARAQTELSTSDFVPRGLRHYVQQNQGNIPACDPDEDELGPSQHLGVLPRGPGIGRKWTPLFG
jgi:hypothetical protein